MTHVWKGASDSKKAKWLSESDLKKQLLESIIIYKVIESEELNREAKEVQDPKKAAKAIQEYENIIKTKKKGIVSIAYHQGNVFKKIQRKRKVYQTS